MRRVVTLTAVAMLVLGGCSSPDPDATASDSRRGSIELITIGLSDTLAPSLEFEAGLEYTHAETLEVWDGDGGVLVNGQSLLLDIYGQSLEDGSVLINTYDGLPRPYLLAPELLGLDLYDALSKANVGARFLHVAPFDENDPTVPPMALVIDVLPAQAQGTPVEPRSDLPIVAVGASGEPQITMREGVEAPGELVVATLIQGHGDQIREGSFISVNYKAVFFDTGEIFDSSWDPGKAPLESQMGVGAVLPGWEQGLIDQTAGSQVILIMPPALAYPDQGTMVFVVDILDVWNPEE
jgi:peptidylprolyl isomerase